MNLGFKSKLVRSPFEQSIRTSKISTVAKTYVESYVKSLVEIRCTRRLEYNQVVLMSWYST